MSTNTFYSEILTEHNLYPCYKKQIENPNLMLEGVNPSCGDDIVIQLRVEDDIIKDGGFIGDGCAISQASADIMLDLIIGKHKDEALQLADIFIRMIKKDATLEEIEQLREAKALQDISHMPSRVKCAVLGWRTIEDMLSPDQE